jgi:hypothetical protein
MTDVFQTTGGRAFETIARIITPLGILVLLILQGQFVTRAEFHKHIEKVERLEQVLIRMEKGAETDSRHEKLLADHELRLRVLEKTATR